MGEAGDARGATGTTGVEPEKVPGIIIIKQMLNLEANIVCSPAWCMVKAGVMQAGYAIPETLPESGDIPATAKQIKPAFTCFAGLWF